MRQKLSGWGRTAWSYSDVVTPSSSQDISAVVAAPQHRGVIARGLGRSYGAASQNAGGTVIEMANDDASPISLDPRTGVVTAGAGVSIDALLKYCVPRGWFVPVTPGTRFVTIGGAIGSDIHGKNHHVDGSFGAHVLSMRVMLSTTEIIELSPSIRPDWFWATIAGMGLTGIVIDATFQMLAISSSMMHVETERLQNFDALIGAMGSSSDDDGYRYSVAWVDLLASGSSLGRGVLSRGEHATRDQDSRSEPLVYDPKVRISAPPWVPNGVINKLSIKAFNEAWYRKAPRRRTESIESIAGFFHPLDGVRQWNRLYGSQGFIQYQFIVPLDQTDVLRTVIGQFADAGVASFLAVLKRMGESNLAPMSFPTAGWTLTLDIAAGARGLPELLSAVDTVVLDAGGRHYLAKDAHVSPGAVRKGYDRFEEWKTIRNEMDPTGVWKSDLGRRLGLVDP